MLDSSCRRQVLFCFAAVALAAIMAGCGSANSQKMTITTKSEKAREYYLKGMDCSENFRISEARKYFEMAVAEDSDFALAYLGLAGLQTSAREALQNLGEADELSRPQEVRSSRQSSSGLGMSLALPVAMASEYLDEASRRVDKVSRGERLLILATKAVHKGNVAEELGYLRELVQLCPAEARFHWMLGNTLFMRAHDDSAALVEYHRAVAINSNYAPVYNMLGYANWSIGDIDAADRAFRKYIEIAPDGPNPYDSYAEFLQRQGRFEESISYCELALERDSLFHHSHTGIAADLNFLGRHEEARAMLNELDSDTNLPVDFRRNLEWAITISYLDEGDLEGALEASKHRMETTQQLGSAYEEYHELTTMSLLMIELGRLQEAEETYDKGLAILDESDLPAETKQHLENIRFARRDCPLAIARKDIAEAKRSIEEFVSHADTAGNLGDRLLANFWLGRIAYEEGNFSETIQWLNQSYLQDAFVQYHLGEAYEQEGNSSEAVKCYDKAAREYLANDFDYALVHRRALAAFNRLTAS